MKGYSSCMTSYIFCLSFLLIWFNNCEIDYDKNDSKEYKGDKNDKTDKKWLLSLP